MDKPLRNVYFDGERFHMWFTGWIERGKTSFYGGINQSIGYAASVPYMMMDCTEIPNRMMGFKANTSQLYSFSKLSES